MVNLPIFDRTGATVGEYAVDPQQLAPRINKQLLHDVVVMYQANQRQGTKQTKNRSLVAGTTKKMYRQKGTGNARAGSRRSGIRRGGGHMKQVLPRDYTYRLPRRAVQAATRMAIASKILDQQIVVIDQLGFTVPKTREMVGVLKALGLAETSTLVTLERHDTMVYKSARNIQRVTVTPVEGLNALVVLTPERMLVTKAALDRILGRGTEAVAS
ncbi:MAG: 50S ribosomal protein L4 [Pirellulaceae bacterium]